MYKCTECGLEYDKKPEYCDCGNDEFVLTIEDKKPENPVKEAVNTVPEQKEEPNIVQSQIYNEISPKARINIEPISMTIFILCLILSFLIIFAWKPAEKEVKAPIKKETVNVEIPSINKLWKESQIQQPEVKKEEPKQPVMPAVVKTQSKPAPVVKKTTQTKPVIKKQTAKPVQKTAPKQVQKQEVKKPIYQPVTETVSSEAEKQAKIAEQAQKLLQAQQDKQEYATYKINLRNEIGRKVDFTKVIGDGSCVVAFSLNSSGKLVNRTFEQKSTNMTLNDAVYKAVMSTPTYNPPPALYKGETFRISISFNNGNFSITLK